MSCRRIGVPDVARAGAIKSKGGITSGGKDGRLPPNEKMGAGVMGGGTLALTQPVGIARRHNRFAPWDVPSWGSCADRRDHQSRRRHGD